MRIVLEILLWISGIAGTFLLGMVLGIFAEFFKSSAFQVYDLSVPLSVALPFLFVCVRLWTLERRAVQKTSLVDR